jgi:hypothetical protein
MRTDGVPWWCSCQLVFGLTAAVCLSFFVAVAWCGEQGAFIQGDGAYYYAWTRPCCWTAT